MKYLLLAGHSIMWSCSLFCTKRVNSSFNVACSPLTNLFKVAEKVCCFSCSSRTAERASSGGSGRIWCDASGCTEESLKCRNNNWKHVTQPGLPKNMTNIHLVLFQIWLWFIYYSNSISSYNINDMYTIYSSGCAKSEVLKKEIWSPTKYASAFIFPWWVYSLILQVYTKYVRAAFSCLHRKALI